jgi:hypothetical protein
MKKVDLQSAEDDDVSAGKYGTYAMVQSAEKKTLNFVDIGATFDSHIDGSEVNIIDNRHID